MIFTKFQKLKKKLTCWKKLAKKKNIFRTGPPPPPELHIRIVKQNPNFMYWGTWIWRKIKISCTRVHGFEEKTKYHVPGYMEFWIFFKSMYPSTWNLIFFSLFLCVAQVVEARVFISFYFWHFFSTCEKISQFFEFCKDQGGKI